MGELSPLRDDLHAEPLLCPATRTGGRVCFQRKLTHVLKRFFLLHPLSPLGIPTTCPALCQRKQDTRNSRAGGHACDGQEQRWLAGAGGWVLHGAPQSRRTDSSRGGQGGPWTRVPGGWPCRTLLMPHPARLVPRRERGCPSPHRLPRHKHPTSHSGTHPLGTHHFLFQQSLTILSHHSHHRLRGRGRENQKGGGAP